MNFLNNIIPVIRHGLYREAWTGWSIEKRTIDDHELVLIEKGTGIVNIEGKDFEAEPGMLFYFYPGLEHSLVANDKNPFSFYAVHFSYCFFKKEDKEWKLITGPDDNKCEYDYECNNKCEYDYNYIAKLPIPDVQKIAQPGTFLETLKKTIDQFNKKLPNWEMSSRFYLENFIYKLFNEIPKGEVNYGARIKIDNVAKYINENVHKNLSVVELATLANVSSDYLTKIFKSYTGYTLVKYIHQCKIQQAKSLLLEGNNKVKDIADSLGFSDEFHFSKVFKKIEGISPRAFKRQS